MKTIKATCGTERMIECQIIIYSDNNLYSINLDGLVFDKGQSIYGLGYYEELALKNTLKKIDNKEIREQIKKQFRL